jgi:uncharacterized membrane protein HdeD (DUF308 family)
MKKLYLLPNLSCNNLKRSDWVKGYSMTQFNIFIIRAVFGAVFAVVLTRMFYGKVEIVYVIGLAVFLVGMAYVMEYFRKKREKKP